MHVRACLRLCRSICAAPVPANTHMCACAHASARKRACVLLPLPSPNCPKCVLLPLPSPNCPKCSARQDYFDVGRFMEEGEPSHLQCPPSRNMAARAPDRPPKSRRNGNLSLAGLDRGGRTPHECPLGPGLRPQQEVQTKGR